MRDRVLELIGHTAHTQQQLILLRANARLLGCSVAEVKEAAKLKTKLGKALEICAAKRRFRLAYGTRRSRTLCYGSHISIVTRYIVLRCNFQVVSQFGP